MTKKWWWFAIGCILVLAMGLRMYQLGQIPTGIYWDEVAMLVDAKSIAQTGHDMHGRVWYQVLYPSYGDYKLPVYIWLATLSVKIFGVSAWALRLPSALAGTATVLVAGYCAYLALQMEARAKDQWLPWLGAVSTMMVVALSPWSMMFSRTAFEGHVGQLLLALSVAASLASRRWRWLWYLSPIVGAAATYSYFSVRFVWPVVFVALWFWLSWLELPNKPGFKPVAVVKSVGLKLVLPLFLFGLCLLPMTNSPLYGDSNRFRLGTDSVLRNETEILTSNVYREIAGNTPLDRIVFHRWWLTAQELFKNYSDNLSLNFLFTTGDPNLRHGTGEFGLFLWPLLPIFLWGWYQLFDKHRGLFFVLVLWWLAAALPASVPENTPHALRTLNALVPISIAIGTGLGYSLHSLWQRAQIMKEGQEGVTSALYAVFSVWVALFVWSAVTFTHYYFTIYPQTSAESWQQGYPEVAKAIVEVRENAPVFIESFDDKFYLWMLAFGPYSGADFQSWPTVGYQFQTFDGIAFKPFPGWNNVDGPRVIIAGRVKSIEAVMATHPMVITHAERISDPAGTDQFMVIVAKKKL